MNYEDGTRQLLFCLRKLEEIHDVSIYYTLIHSKSDYGATVYSLTKKIKSKEDLL